jgi:hypothetical protein
MDLTLIAAIVLLAFEAVYNAWEFFVVYRSRNDKAKMMEAHSQIGEGSELVAFILAGILLYLSDINLILVVIVFILGIYHVGGAITKKDSFSKWSEDRIKKFSLIPMVMCAIEVIFSIYVITAVIPML